MKFYRHKVCKCDICDVCITKHDGNKCLKCKKSVKKDVLKKFQIEIAENLCMSCKIKPPSGIEKTCECKICQDCVFESPLVCKNCRTENFLVDKKLEDEVYKKNVICTFLKEKLEKVSDFEEKLMADLSEIYKIIEKSKNFYLKEIENIKKVISDNIKNLADLTLLKYLTLPRKNLENSISHSLILDLKTNFDLKHLEDYFEHNFQVDFSIEVPVCFKCHQHLFVHPVKLTGCDCRLCKDCIIKNLNLLPACPHCSEITKNLEEVEEYCGETIQKLCKSCYQTKNSSVFYQCGKGCMSCFDCLTKYLKPNPQCPICSLVLNNEEVQRLVDLRIINYDE